MARTNDGVLSSTNRFAKLHLPQVYNGRSRIKCMLSHCNIVALTMQALHIAQLAHSDGAPRCNVCSDWRAVLPRQDVRRPAHLRLRADKQERVYDARRHVGRKNKAFLKVRNCALLSPVLRRAVGACLRLLHSRARAATFHAAFRPSLRRTLVASPMDSDLAALRQQAAAGGGGGGSAGEHQKARAEAEAKEAQRKQMLDAILAPDAKERLARIRLVKPDKAFGVENLLLNAAQSGRLKNQVDEATLVDMLRQVSEQQEKAKKVTITRKKDPFDDDDDDDLFDMS